MPPEISAMTQHTRLKAHWFHILLSLADRDLHGTAIMEEVLERTSGHLRLWPGKLYGALRDMTDDGLIHEVEAPADAPTEGGKRRFYSVTRRGRLVLHEEVERLATLVRVARAKGASGGPA
jgi:DNA-binding PadR family transcriptional regulator